MTTAARWFRRLLLVYPAHFRREFGDDMTALFVRRLADARAAGLAWRFVVRTVLNVIAAAAAERWRSRPIHPRVSPFTTRSISMSGLTQDLRFAWRGLRRQPGFTAFVVLTLAIGIGATTAVFSVVNSVLLRPLPFEDPGQLVAVWGRFDPESGMDFPQFTLSPPEFVDYRTATKAMADVAAFTQVAVTLGGGGGLEPERAQASGVTPNLFGLLRVQPVLGRTFTEDEGKPGGPPVVILSHGLWQSRYGGDPSIVGRTISMNGAPSTVVGVMPPGFAYPRNTVRLWGPLRIDPANPGHRKSHTVRAVARLAPGVTIEGARAELDGMMQDWRSRFPDVHTGHYLFLRPMLDDVVGTIRPALLTLLAATGFVLLIVCANVASVVLARGESRERDMAIRGALGAERWRLIRLSLVESGLLAGAGAALGLLIAQLGVRALIALDPTTIPRADQLKVDTTVVVFAAASACVCAALFGLLPAVRGGRGGVQGMLRAAATTIVGSGNSRYRQALVAVEVGLAVILVLGAGLMLRSFSRLLDVDPGFRSTGLVSAAVSLPPASYRDAEAIDLFFARLVERVRSVPEVSAASAGTIVPLWSNHSQWDFDVEGRPTPGAGQPTLNASIAMVRPGYFETIGVDLVQGRFFVEADDARGQPVVVINEALAKTFFAGEDPVGRRIRVANSDRTNEWMTIVGVASDMRSSDLTAPPRPMYFIVQSQTERTAGSPLRSISILARSEGDPTPVMNAVRSVVRELDPALPVYDLQTSRAVLEQSVARPRFTTVLLTTFALVAIVLGASGVYGVLAYTVARRTREIGIRRALGASPSRLTWDVVSDGLRPVALGIVGGLAVAFWTAGLWRSQLFDVSPTDPAVYAGAALAALAVALLATCAPVSRALRIDPSTALRDGA